MHRGGCLDGPAYRRAEFGNGQLSPFAELGIGVGQAQFTPSAIGQSVVLSWEPKVPFIANAGWGWYAYTDQVAGTHSGQVGVLRTRY